MLDSLVLHDFRCFLRAEFHPAPGLNLLSAPNASGKSSLLEGICVALRLQSPRAGVLTEVVRRGAGGFSLLGRCGDRELACHYSAGEGRQLKLDGVAQRKSEDYLRVGLVAFFANEDIELVRGSSSKRRRFVDFLASQCDAGYLKNLRAYERALRSRNFLLKEGAHRGREISAYDGPLLAAGDYLGGVRRGLCAELAPIVARHVTAISPRAEVSGLRYERSGGEDLAAALSASAGEERRLRQTLVGPHRDDILLELEGPRRRLSPARGSSGRSPSLCGWPRRSSFARAAVRRRFIYSTTFSANSTPSGGGVCCGSCRAMRSGF